MGVGLAALTLVFAPTLALAKVTVSINGSSNNQGLYAHKGPKGINTKIKVSRSAGSISDASARAIFKKHTVNIGNQVISAGTEGDEFYTHVRAGSLFFGKAKFVAAKKGAKVKNFKINYHVDGTLECYSPDDSLGEGYSLASVESQIDFNQVNRFVGTASVDGYSGYDGGAGDFSGHLSGDTYSVALDKDFKVNLGTVKDGKVYPMLFFGSTLVSYGAEVPIDTCYADFMNTSTFSVDEGTLANKGTLKITPARPVDDVLVDPQPWDLATYPDVTIYLEDANENFLNNIDVNRVQLFERLGDAGSIQPESINEVGDQDADGMPDRGIVFDGMALYSLMEIEVLGYESEVKLFLIGETEAGKPFSAVVPFEVTAL